MIGRLYRRLHAMLHQRRMYRELDEEMAAHREMLAADRRPNFGNTLRLHEQAREAWGWTWLDRLRQDLVYGARSLRRSPGFALTAVAVLALGIGANLAEFHVFDAFLHRLHVRDVDSLCQFRRLSRRGGEEAAFSAAEIGFYRSHARLLSALLSEEAIPGVYDGRGGMDLRCSLVSGNYFAELGIVPLYGRVLTPHDNVPGAPAVAVLSYDYWRNRFGADPTVVMRAIRLNDRPVLVIGIAPPDFSGLGRLHANIWLPDSEQAFLTGAPPPDPHIRRTQMFGRRRPGISRQAAAAEFDSLTAELERQDPEDEPAGQSVAVDSMDRDINKSPQVLLLLSTFILLVLLVLFSACANLGTMLLARGLARQREIEIRLSVGAGRWRLIRQLLTESLLLAVAGGAAALLVGRLGALLVLRITAAPSDMQISTDWRILLSAAALALVATLAFGLAPAIQTVKRGRGVTRMRRLLVAVQLAASCALLILSAFLARGIRHTYLADVTFDVPNMAVVDPLLYVHHYSPAEAREALREMSARLRHVPGVDAVSLATMPPFARMRLVRSGNRLLSVNAVDPSYFAVARLRLLAGRIFGPSDSDAIVISRSAARRLWPNASSPLGKQLAIGGGSYTVIGVVQDSGVNTAMGPESVEVYGPVDDAAAVYAALLVHTTNGAQQSSEMLRSAATLPGLTPLVSTLQSLMDLRLDSVRKMALIIGSLAGVASLLALVGIFGLLAFTVAQRTREIGVRMALGAHGADVVRIVLGQYAAPFAAGTGIGIALAAAVARIFRSTVYGFIPFELWSFASGLLLFAAVALVAAIAPARRALKIDPASALRYE